ncbi:unnamed protein product, partial [Rotaria sordida]
MSLNYLVVLSLFTWIVSNEAGLGMNVHAATLFNSRKTTVGEKSSNAMTMTEIYDPSTDQWTTTGNMATPRIFHTATLLNSGNVLVCGSGGYTGYTATCEIYDTSTGQWHSAASMSIPRGFHTATLLKSGQVLVTGGSSFDINSALASCEIYDPSTNKWSPTANMAGARSSHTATLLNSGKVLITSDAASSQIYDPSTGQWSTLKSMGPKARYNPTATMLKSGEVLVIGGIESAKYSATTEIYHPSTDQWDTVGSMATPRQFHTSILLSSGNVLVTGGVGDADFLASCELYDPSTAKWKNITSMTEERSSHTTTMLKSGKILATAGYGYTGYLDSSEIYDPSTGKWTSSAKLSTTRASHTATMLNSGKVLITGGEKQGSVRGERKAYYHAKSSTNYALKIQITCDFHHRIVHVFECYHGSVHDIAILRDSGLLEHVNDSVQIIADKGYIGEEDVVTQRKKPHGRELTDEDKEFNRDINSARATIENINQRLKTYAILGGVYRGASDNFHKATQIVQVVSALLRTALNVEATIIHDELCTVFDDEAPSYRTIARWAQWFREGREEIEDEERSRRPVAESTLG